VIRFFCVRQWHWRLAALIYRIILEMGVCSRRTMASLQQKGHQCDDTRRSNILRQECQMKSPANSRHLSDYEPQSLWIPDVLVFSPKKIERLNPAVIRTGIEQRLSLLTYLFCPDDEEEPNVVLQRLRIEVVSENELKIRWRPRMRYPTRMFRFGDELHDQIETKASGINSYSKLQKRRAQQILGSTVDGVGFLQAYDRGNMGWPVVIAAAAALVEQVGGVIVTNGFGWFLPYGNEVRVLLEPPAV
jgi:hypothetical protein